jgi:PPOX class probable F420-dependent enzyme
MDRIMARRSTILPADRAFMVGVRRAVLATISPDGRPRLVPICFVVDPERPIVYTPLDEKPKRVDDVRELARVRDILERPAVSLLVDRWDEDWSRLAWLRLGGTASLIEPASDPEGEHAAAVAALRAKHPQYLGHRLQASPLIRIDIDAVTSWGLSDDES